MLAMDNLSSAKEWQRFAEMDLMSAEYFLKLYLLKLSVVIVNSQLKSNKKSYLVIQGINPQKVDDLNSLNYVVWRKNVY